METVATTDQRTHTVAASTDSASISCVLPTTLTTPLDFSSSHHITPTTNIEKRKKIHLSLSMFSIFLSGNFMMAIISTIGGLNVAATIAFVVFLLVALACYCAYAKANHLSQADILKDFVFKLLPSFLAGFLTALAVFSLVGHLLEGILSISEFGTLIIQLDSIKQSILVSIIVVSDFILALWLFSKRQKPSNDSVYLRTESYAIETNAFQLPSIVTHSPDENPSENSRPTERDVFNCHGDQKRKSIDIQNGGESDEAAHSSLTTEYATSSESTEFMLLSDY